MGKIHDILIAHQQEIIESPGLSMELKRMIRKIVHCRTIDLGGHILHCPDHHAFTVLNNSFRQRGCLQCNGHRRLQWRRWKLHQILPVEHIHMVFKLPQELSLLWLLNKKAVGDIMLTGVKESISLWPSASTKYTANEMMG